MRERNGRASHCGRLCDVAQGDFAQSTRPEIENVSHPAQVIQTTPKALPESQLCMPSPPRVSAFYPTAILCAPQVRAPFDSRYRADASRSGREHSSDGTRGPESKSAILAGVPQGSLDRAEQNIGPTPDQQLLNAFQTSVFDGMTGACGALQQRRFRPDTPYAPPRQSFPDRRIKGTAE